MRRTRGFLLIVTASLLALPFSASIAQAQTDSPSRHTDPTRATHTLELDLLRLTNEQRHRVGLADLQMQPPLAQVARQHSQEMLQLNYFRHESPTANMATPLDRVTHIGFPAALVAENIFTLEGYPMQDVADACMQGWMQSPAHRANILSPTYSFFGIGVALGSTSEEAKVMITEVFCGPIDGQKTAQ